VTDVVKNNSVDRVLPPINKQTLLDKICFVRFGKGGLATYREKFKQEIYNFHTRHRISYLSHQTIQNWCDKGHLPARAAAFRFLSEYSATQFENLVLSSSQRKVYNQVVDYLKKTIENTERDRNIFRAKDGRYVLSIKTAPSTIERLASTMSGLYITYRLRFSEQPVKPVAQEMLHISLGHQALNFEHWHQKDDGKLTAFQGCVVPVGEILWFLSVNPNFTNRFRVMHFRDTKGVGSRAGSLRWGIISSDVPQPSSEPVSTRIVLYKVSGKVADLKTAAEKYVRYVSFEEISKKLEPVMRRLLTNTVTSQSKMGTIEPVQSEQGIETTDAVLRVDQHTILAATKIIFDAGGIESVRKKDDL
jgi:hypothetical protein